MEPTQGQPVLTHREGVEAGRKAVAEYWSQAEVLDQERQGIERTLNEAREKVGSIINNLALIFMPQFDRDIVRSAASELDAAHISTRFEDLLRLREALEHRIAVLEKHPDFANAKSLLAAKQRRLAVIRDEEHTLRGEMERYERDQELMRRYAAKDLPVQRGIGSFLFKLILVGFVLDWIEQQRIEEILNRYKVGSLTTLFNRYVDLRDSHLKIKNDFAKLESEIATLHELLDEHINLSSQVAASEEKSLEIMRESVRQYLRVCEMKVVRASVRATAKSHLTQMIALTTKISYLQDLCNKLLNESSDRQTRARKIDRVVGKWKKNPSKQLKGDKQKWLVEGPARMRTKTTRCVHQSHGMYLVVDRFDNYSLLDAALDTYTDFLMWDLFVHEFDGRPDCSVSFVRDTVGEVGQWREEHPGEVVNFGQIDPDGGADDALAAVAEGQDDTHVGDESDTDEDNNNDDGMEDAS